MLQPDRWLPCRRTDGRSHTWPKRQAKGRSSLRPPDQVLASPIGEQGGREPFFSPDGRWIGFRVG